MHPMMTNLALSLGGLYIALLQTEKGVLEAALQNEVTGQATAQAELNIFKAKLNEAVLELEKRTSSAEQRTVQLLDQLVAERGRLVRKGAMAALRPPFRLQNIATYLGHSITVDKFTQILSCQRNATPVSFVSCLPFAGGCHHPAGKQLLSGAGC